MSDSLFYSNIDENEYNMEILSLLKQYSEKHLKQVYVINKPMGEQKYQYEYSRALVVLIPTYKIMLIDYGQNLDAFRTYKEDILEDLGYISDKYEYKKVLGRPREWKNKYIDSVTIDDINKVGLSTMS